MFWRSGKLDDTVLLRELRGSRESHPANWLDDYLIALVHLERDDQETAIKTLEGVHEKEASREEVRTVLAVARERLSQSKRLLRTFEGDTSHRVNSVHLSLDGRYALLGGSYYDTLKLWEVETGRCLQSLEGHTDNVWSVYLSPDSRYALSGSDDKTLKLWDLATGRCLRTFEGHTGRVNSVCLSSDGMYALSGSWDSTLKLWQVGSPNHYWSPVVLSRVATSERVLMAQSTYLRELEEAQEALGSGDAVASANHVRKARSQPGYSRGAQAMNAWAALYVRLPRKAFGGGWEEVTFEGHVKGVNSVHLSLDGRYALSGGFDTTPKLWEVATPAVACRLSKSTSISFR